MITDAVSLMANMPKGVAASVTFFDQHGIEVKKVIVPCSIKAGKFEEVAFDLDHLVLKNDVVYVQHFFKSGRTYETLIPV